MAMPTTKQKLHVCSTIAAMPRCIKDYPAAANYNKLCGTSNDAFRIPPWRCLFERLRPVRRLWELAVIALKPECGAVQTYLRTS